MSRKTLFILLLLTFAMSSTVAMAQDPKEESASEPAADPSTEAGKSFKLLRDDDSAAGDLNLMDEEVEAWLPGLKSGTVEVSLGVGFMDLNKSLLQHDQMIYKYTTEATFWGDVELNGETAFAPTLRLGYGLTKWFSLEGWSGVSISQYSSTIENRHSRKNEPEAPVVDDPPLGEFDAETRSLITLQAGINAVVYPLAIGGDGMGRWHPFLTGGVGTMWYDINSNFTGDTASSMDVNFGAGIRLLVDRNVSLRMEIMVHRNELEWTPADYFVKLDEGTTLVPLNEYPVQPDGSIDERPITEFASKTMNLLQFSIGVQGNF